ncbi:polysaccharide biosynthesis tyrosine autokinase [Chitinophaga agrisoli]|uniref:non-specific protein-tyrosine kinase n=1 Tax=Chitinophaga agrisoli TaxID=2607653 RepID=A0A5B2VKJ0_9BACT|nr:polysaccharide biosynthesis tyrosine autokinase [Chitinophaga agrisoli]KAA2239198.1 polysaccharide biosynthesis tyrosine autokinase [Chitinophaga agrisoli]
MQDNIYSNGKSGTNGLYPTDQPESNAPNLRKVLDKYLRYWYLFIICAILGVIGAWLYLRYSTAYYNITAKVLVQDAQKGGGAGEEIMEQMQLFDNKSNVDNEVEILNSRSLMERVVKTMELNVTCYVQGRVKKSEQYGNLPFHVHVLYLKDTLKPVTYILEPDGEKGFRLTKGDLARTTRWGDTVQLPEGLIRVERTARFPLEQPAYLVRIKSIDDAVAEYKGLVEFNVPNRQVSTIDLNLVYAVPEKGELVLSRLLQTYLAASVEDKNRIADSTIDFIDRRLVIVSRELAGVEQGIQNFKQANELTDLDEQAKQLVTGSGDFAKQLTEQQVKLSVVDGLEQYIKDEKNNKRIVPTSLVVQDPTFTGLVEKYNTLQLERERQLMSSTESNPMVRNMDQQLAGLRTDILNNLLSFKAGVQASVQELERNAGMLTTRIRQVPAKERVFLDYSRQQTIKQELYLYLLKKREESAISKTSNMAVARVIDPAKSDALPFTPKRILIYLVGLILGVVVPAAFLYLKEVLNRRVLDKDDILQHTPVPILAEIGHSDDKDMVVVTANARTPVAEQFRAMRTNLQFVLTGANEKVILLTSSMSGEGKSFIATNLAAILAVSGKKVVLLEMDLRKPKISEKLHLSNQLGFSNYSIGKASLNEIIRPSGIHDNCWLISSGPVPPNPAELMLLNQTSEMFQELRRRFDYVIIDTAPIGLVTDAQLLGRFADVTLFVIRQGHTFKQQLQFTKDLYVYKRMPKMELVVNDVKKASAYGYGYGYGAGYGYGYYDQKEDKSVLGRVKKTFIGN